MTEGETGKTRIWLSSRRPDLLMKKIIGAYAGETEVRIDGDTYGDRDLPVLDEEWCTRRKIGRTARFALTFHGRQLFGFEGGPQNLWAAYSELAFVQHLEERGLARYSIGTKRPGLLDRLKERLGRR